MRRISMEATWNAGSIPRIITSTRMGSIKGDAVHGTTLTLSPFCFLLVRPSFSPSALNFCCDAIHGSIAVCLAAW